LGEDSEPTGLYFNSTGTKMFMIARNTDSVFQYSLTTGFDLSTASFDNVSFDVSGQDGEPTDVYFNPAGTRMFMLGRGSDSVHQYSLSTGFDLSTATYNSVSFSVSTEDTAPWGIFFNSTGTRMFMSGTGTDSIYQYSLGTGFDLNTALYDNISFDVSSEDNGPLDIYFDPSGTKMFMLGVINDSVFQYNL
jgi:hypothetical protein